MPTGDVKTKVKDGFKTARATALRVLRDSIVMSLEDGREISIPLRLYPSLLKAKPAERNSFEMIGDGRAFHWGELDLDLSVEGLLHGLPERIPAPPSAAQKMRARKRA